MEGISDVDIDVDLVPEDGILSSSPISHRVVQPGAVIIFSPPRTRRENLIVSINNTEHMSCSEWCHKIQDNLNIAEICPRAEIQCLSSSEQLLVETHRTKTPKSERPTRNPAWFLDIDQVCFKCKRRCPRLSLHQHIKHSPGKVVYEDAPLLRDFHLTMWADLLHSVIMIIMQKLNISSRQALTDYIIRHKIAEGCPHKVNWSKPFKHALNRYFLQFGGIIRPEFITLNPPNSTLVLVFRPIFDKLLKVNPVLNSAIYRGLKLHK